MKKGANTFIVAAAAAAMTAAYHAPAPNEARLQEAASVAAAGAVPLAPHAKPSGSEESPCRAYIDAPQNASDSSTYGDALRVWKKFSHTDPQPDIRYVVAFAPDPIHTQLSLQFDRTMEAIQAAAQDETYVYDSSWLPWELDAKTYPVRSDENSEEAAVESREGCPGMILFRKRREDGADQAYSHGLAVFVVADEPTQGINQEEWNEAIRVIAEEGKTGDDLHVLGPSFSGSLPSLSRLLAPGAMFQQSGFKAATIYSGAISSCWAITHFLKNSAASANPHVVFGSFSENSELQIYRLLKHFDTTHQSLTDVAILSEDETAYGQSDAEPHLPAEAAGGAPNAAKQGAQPSTQGSCAYDYGTRNMPVWLFYPRDISAVRTAYLEQSIFSRARQEGGENLSLRRVLRPAAPTVSSTQTDTVRRYSQDEVPLDEEARLYELVSFLRSHHAHYVVLRGTNSDDLLFLTRFFHHSYPEGRIILMRSDEMLRREIDTSEFRGVMLLTNYPLLPREQHWARLISRQLNGAVDRHVHRIFPSDTIEGEYLAARFLFDPVARPTHHDKFALYQDSFKENVPDYADPIWLHADSPHDDTVCAPSTPCYPLKDDYMSPPTWLVTVGRDGNWPIAVLSDAPRGQYPRDKRPPPSTITKLSRKPLKVSAPGETPRIQNAVYYWSGNSRSAPVPWRIALMAIMAFALFHTAALWKSLDPRRAPGAVGFRDFLFLFRPAANLRAELFLGTATGIVFCAAFLLLLAPLLNHRVWDLNYGEYSLYLFAALTLVLVAAVVWALSSDEHHRRTALPAFCATIVAWGAIVFYFTLQDERTDSFSLLYRSAHLTNGVSPLLPLLLILGGLYFSTMLSLREVDLMASAPVRLARSDTGSDVAAASAKTAKDAVPCGKASQQVLDETAREKDGSGPIPGQFSRICQQFAGRIDAYVQPLSARPSIWLPPIFVAFAAVWLFHDEGGTLTLEGRRYSFTLLYCLMLVGVAAMNHALNLNRSWGAMKLMLRALGREPLRRTFAAMRSSPDSSIWALGSGARGEQMRALSNEVESLTHLRNLLRLQPAEQSDILSESWACYAIENARCWAEKFKESYVTDALPGDLDQVRSQFCHWLGRAVEDVFNWILIPAWNREKESINLNTEAPDTAKSVEDKDSEEAKEKAHLSSDPVVRAAEEFVCQVYAAYTKKTLSCMRSAAKSVGILFLALGAAISCYPILSRTTVVFALLVIVAAVFVMVARVYMEMARDEILSLMTGTKPGELGSEFWIKLLTFGVGPLAGLIAALFPSVAETIFSVLGPSLDVMK